MTLSSILSMPPTLHHVGIAVRSLSDATATYQTLCGGSLYHREILTERNIEVAFLKLGNTLFEFLAPLNEMGVIQKFIDSKGEGLHHLCYKVDDIHSTLSRCQELGWELIDHAPRSGAMSSLIAFVHPRSVGGVLTEFCQEGNEEF